MRAPARPDREFSLIFPLFNNFPIIRGGPYFESEIAKVYELGYRAQPSPALSYSITAFRQDYEKLRSGMPPPAFIENRIRGFENGIEAWAALQATRIWRLSAGVSTLHKHLGIEPGSPDPTGPIALGNDPQQQWMLRSSLSLAGGHELDVMARRIGWALLEEVVMKDGRVVESGDTLEVLDNPAHPYTRDLLDATLDKSGVPATRTAV